MLSPTLLTGSTGRLGRALIELLPNLQTPTRNELDITNAQQINQTLTHYKPSLIIHAAAYTNVSAAEHDRATCWQVNVEGTRNIVQAARTHSVKLIHISTDYVFAGTHGNYREDDTLGPPCNYYAQTKLAAEEAVRALPQTQHLIVRTSFRDNTWPYETAFTDVYTSQDYLDVIAPDIALLINNHARCPYSTLHIATERKSAYELAKRRRPQVRSGSRHDIAVTLPADISLNTDRWQALKQAWSKIIAS